MNRPKYALLYGITIICALFEATLSYQLNISSVRPELVFVIPVFWGLQARSDEVTFHACTAGLIKDLFSATPFGTYGVLFLVFAYIICTIRSYLYRDSIITLVLVGFLFELCVNLLQGFGFYLLGGNLTVSGTISFAIYTALYSCICGTALLKPMVHYEQEFGFYHY